MMEYLNFFATLVAPFLPIGLGLLWKKMGDKE